jgi:hypothetical protein
MRQAESRKLHDTAGKEWCLELVTEALSDDARTAPLCRWCSPRRRRGRVLADEGEYSTGEVLRRPRRKRNSAAGLQHPAHFRDGDIRPGRKHVTELADNDIKLAIREWKTFGISLEPLRVSERGYSRILARNVEQSRRQVEPVIDAPARAAVIATTPVPVPTSSTVSLGLTSANSTRCAATGVVKAAVGANDAHISRWRVFRSANGSTVDDIAPPPRVNE